MNYEIRLDNLVIEEYPHLDNCLLNVDVVSYYKNKPGLKYPILFDSDWESTSYTDIDLEIMWGETKRKDGKIVPLSAHQIDEVAEEYADVIEQMLIDILEEDKEGWYE